MLYIKCLLSVFLYVYVRTISTALLEEAEKRKSLLSGYNQETLLQDEKQWQVLYQRYQQLCLHVISADEACQKGM